MPEISPISGNTIIDGTEHPRIADRLSRAVMQWNVANPEAQATFEVYANKTDAEPPINSRDAAEGEIYTRMSLPEGTFTAIQDIAIDLSYIDSPRRNAG